MNPEDEQIERLKQNIAQFNHLMKLISEDFSNLVLMGNEEAFHEILIEMVKSLDNAQETVQKAYYLFEKRTDKVGVKEIVDNEAEKEKVANMKKKLREYTMFMERFSEELNSKLFKGNFKVFQEVVEDMIESLDKTRKSMNKVYFQANFGKDWLNREPKGSGGGP